MIERISLNDDIGYLDSQESPIIWETFIKPEYRMKGYGSKLINEFEEELINRGIDEIYAFVYKNDNRARKFYEKNGFQKKDKLVYFKRLPHKFGFSYGHKDKTIPIFKPEIDDAGIAEVIKTLRSGWWASGKKVKEFEEKFAKFTGARYAVATNSCTSALDIAVRLLDWEDKPITVPAFTFISSAIAPHSIRHPIKFVDINENTLCADYADIIVHYAGNMYGEGKIHDMAHCAGEKHRDILSCWSFHAVKNLPCGDGGMITMNDKKLYDRAKALSWCGIKQSTYERSKGKYNWEYDIDEIGFKAQMNDITATIGLASLRNLRKNNKRRKEIANLYNELLPPIAKRPPISSTWHLYTIRVPNRDGLIDFLKEKGVDTSVHYKPLYYYSVFEGAEKLPITEKVFKDILTLPMYPSLTDEQVKSICQLIKQFYG